MKNRLINLIIVIISIIISSCVYFNTFYNAKLFFDEAEKLRLETNSEVINNKIAGKYSKVIEKSDLVITKYPKSKFVDDAIYLKGRSHYYKQEFEEAEASFKLLATTNQNDYGLLSDYWLAKVKWKTGNPDLALTLIAKVISNTNDDELLLDGYQSQAEIYLILEQDSLAVTALEKSANLTKNRRDSGAIYYRLAQLAYDTKHYDSAVKYYQNVINYSIRKERILDSYYKIVQCYRELGDYERASKEILKMLDDQEFVGIHPDLSLEMAKLKLIENDIDAALELFEEIAVDFPNTQASAEALFIIGEKLLIEKRDFSAVDYYFKQVQKEMPSSTFREKAQKRVKELDQYKKSKDYLKSIKNNHSDQDSLSTDRNIQEVDSLLIANELYNLGELEAFHFGQIDTSIIYFKQIVDDFPATDVKVKAIYALSYLLDKLDNQARAAQYREDILKFYPDTEYAEHIRLNFDYREYGSSGFERLSKAENLYLINPNLAIVEYKDIAKLQNSEAAKRALLFVANEYDQNYFSPDSAILYYNQILQKFPNSEQAEFANFRMEYLTIKTSEKAINPETDIEKTDDNESVKKIED